ncbi:uncharacterized protein [Alexandromys fortis]|uniref:uncharacterized protein n=1 Tax=Alexandromys fortis TaxID=100897 RepID=UPI002152D3C7|nr:uncharacterized protein LOC126490539 [Microtus fortis]
MPEQVTTAIVEGDSADAKDKATLCEVRFLHKPQPAVLTRAPQSGVVQRRRRLQGDAERRSSVLEDRLIWKAEGGLGFSAEGAEQTASSFPGERPQRRREARCTPDPPVPGSEPTTASPRAADTATPYTDPSRPPSRPPPRLPGSKDGPDAKKGTANYRTEPSLEKKGGAMSVSLPLPSWSVAREIRVLATLDRGAWVSCLHVCLCSMCMQSLLNPEEGIRSAGTGVTDSDLDVELSAPSPST